MHSKHNEGKSVITERFIRTFKNKMYKYVTSISKNVYIDKLDTLLFCKNDFIDLLLNSLFLSTGNVFGLQLDSTKIF